MFREKILDKIIREELKDVVDKSVQAQRRKEKLKLKKKLKSQEQFSQNRTMVSPNPERGFLEHNFKKEIIKKKHMLDLMMQKKMSKRKKKIIKVYGKDMLAEMYLDLLNVTEGEAIPKRILSPLSGRAPKNLKLGGKKRRWNNDNTMQERNPNFKLNSESIFNLPNSKKSSRSNSRNMRNPPGGGLNNRVMSEERSREEIRSHGGRSSIRSGNTRAKRIITKSNQGKRFNRTHCKFY